MTHHVCYTHVHILFSSGLRVSHGSNEAWDTHSKLCAPHVLALTQRTVDHHTSRHDVHRNCVLMDRSQSD